jgi:hypothetical protein
MLQAPQSWPVPGWIGQVSVSAMRVVPEETPVRCFLLGNSLVSFLGVVRLVTVFTTSETFLGFARLLCRCHCLCLWKVSSDAVVQKELC